MPELRDLLTILPLLFLAGREAVRWIYGREAADIDHGKAIRALAERVESEKQLIESWHGHFQQQLDSEVADRRKLWHESENRIHALLLTQAVQDQRLIQLERSR